MNNFLPVTMKEARDRGWDSVDFVLVTGDAYVDHPSFGAAVISRILEASGFRTGIIAQPDWQDVEAFRVFGKPELGFLVTSGNVDSMVAHYTSFKKKRSTDLFSPGGQPGLRPDRALIVYTSKIREAYKNTAVILGGLEASLRRFAHYDYWSNSLRRSILADSKADMLIYGMGEKAVIEIAERLSRGKPVKEITGVKGTVYRTSDISSAEITIDKNMLVKLYAYEEAEADKKKFAANFATVYNSSNDPETAPVIAEKTGAQYIVQNPPQLPADQALLDRIYSLPYTRKAHPVYEKAVPALTEVEQSITASRGCFGGCSFCAIAYHQGKLVTSRSHESVLAEAALIAGSQNFKGYIHDVGGPTANFRLPACRLQKDGKTCARQCLAPSPCPQIEADHSEYASLLRKIEKIDGVKKVFVRSGIRFDYLMLDKDIKAGKPGNFLSQLASNHVSGQLKTAPEHVSDHVLKLMGKPGIKFYEDFAQRFYEETKAIGKKQYLLPYFISAHPGSTIDDAIELALYLKKNRFIPDQIQDFYPTPGTLSTCMYYTGLNPLTMEEVYVPSSIDEKKMQKALLHFNKPENHSLVKKALLKAGREDLIGNHPGALIPLFPPAGTFAPPGLQVQLRPGRLRDRSTPDSARR